MINEYIKVLDNLRPEEARFDFDPLNKNFCFCAPEVNPSTALSNLTSGITGGDSGGSGGTTESGGLSEEDQAMKQMFYDEIKELFDTEYTPYEGDRFADRSQEEIDLTGEMQRGADYDRARGNLGFTSDAFKKGAQYGVGDLDRDAGELMGAGSTYRDQVADTTMRQMTEAATRSGMINRGNQIGGGTAWSDRSRMQDSWNNQNYLSAAGDQLGKMNMGAYNNALDRVGSLNANKLNAAGRYGNTVMQDLGIGTQGLSSKLGGYSADRSYLDRDNKWDKKLWDDEQNYPFKKLAYSSGLYSGMPFEEKVVSNQPASGGK